MKDNDVYVNDYYTLAGVMEGKGKIKGYNYVLKDNYFDEDTAEKAEMKMQQLALNYVIKGKKVDYIIGSDLSNQIGFSSMTASKFDIPFIGLYSACASFVLGLINAKVLINSGAENVAVFTSSHNLNSEKQFRFPIEYGCPKPDYSTFTATGSVSALISKSESNIRITSYTIGKVKNANIKDAFNMGGVMAISAADTLYNHLKKHNLSTDDYDLILTGDLGKYGEMILKEVMKKEYGINLKNYLDAGTLIYNDNQKTYAGASGPISLPLVLFGKILKQRKHKKILIIGTGSLHSKVLVNQKNYIPSIAHAVSLEVK